MYKLIKSVSVPDELKNPDSLSALLALYKSKTYLARHTYSFVSWLKAADLNELQQKVLDLKEQKNCVIDFEKGVCENFDPYYRRPIPIYRERAQTELSTGEILEGSAWPLSSNRIAIAVHRQVPLDRVNMTVSFFNLRHRWGLHIIKIWDFEEKQFVSRMVCNPTGSFEKIKQVVELSRDQIACSMNNGNIQIWDIVRQKLVTALKAHRSAINRMTVTPDGDFLSESQGVIKIWDSRSLRCKGILRVPNSNINSEPVSDMVISENGQLVVADGQGFKIYRIGQFSKCTQFTQKLEKLLIQAQERPINNHFLISLRIFVNNYAPYIMKKIHQNDFKCYEKWKGAIVSFELQDRSIKDLMNEFPIVTWTKQAESFVSEFNFRYRALTGESFSTKSQLRTGVKTNLISEIFSQALNRKSFFGKSNRSSQILSEMGYLNNNHQVTSKVLENGIIKNSFEKNASSLTS